MARFYFGPYFGKPYFGRYFRGSEELILWPPQERRYIETKRTVESVAKDLERAKVEAKRTEDRRIAYEKRIAERTASVLGKLKAKKERERRAELLLAEEQARGELAMFLALYEQAQNEAIAAFREYEAIQAEAERQTAILAEQLRIKQIMESEIRDIMTIMLMEV